MTAPAGRMAEEALRDSGLSPGSFPLVFFRRALARSRLSHAYLFLGPEGSGRRRFARELAKAVTCERGLPCGACPSCAAIEHRNHPAVHFYAVAEGKNTIEIAEVRDLAARVHLRRRGLLVSILEDADRMGLPAANALLKTLEEPTGLALLILIARSSGLLLPTIVSRCQRIPFLAPPAPEPPAAPPAPGDDPAERFLSDVAESGFVAERDLREWLPALVPGAPSAREAVRRLLDALVVGERARWAREAGGAALTAGRPPESAHTPGGDRSALSERSVERLWTLLELREDLDRNVHADLVLEALLSTYRPAQGS